MPNNNKLLHKRIDGKRHTAISGFCMFTHKYYETPFVSSETMYQALEEWTVSGKCIQDAFPFFNPSDREFVKSGISPNGWNSTFQIRLRGKGSGLSRLMP